MPLTFLSALKELLNGGLCMVCAEIFLLGEEAFLLNHNSACSAYTLEEEGEKSQTPRKRVSVCSREDRI